MPRYFLNHVHRDDRILDEEGEEFSTLEAVRREVIVSAREIMAERLTSGRTLNHSRFEVEDETGEVVLVVPFNDAMPTETD